MNDMSAATGWESDDRLAAEAIRRIKARRDFRVHLLVYVAVNILMILIWLTTAATAGAWYPWFVFPLTGWGIGVAAHGWAVHGSPSRPITQEAIAEEVERMRREHPRRVAEGGSELRP
jgi:2TM domain